MLKLRTHFALAAVCRALPAFTGKGRLARFLHRRLLAAAPQALTIRRVRMHDGSSMIIDLRSNTEWLPFYFGSYENVLPAVLKLLREPGVALDVGANVGFYTIPLGRHMQALQGRCIAFEPVPANYARLLENIKANHLDEAIQALPLAVGEVNAQITMLRDDQRGAQTGNAARVRHAAFNDGQLERQPLYAQMIRLDDHVERLGLNDLPCRFVKVDIEGHEPSFFDGAAVFLKKHRPLMLAEVNPVWLARNQFGVDDYFRRLGPEGYAFFVWQQNRWIETPRPEDFPSDTRIRSLLLVPPGFSQTASL